MTTLEHVIASQQSEWVSFSEDPLFPVSSERATEEHLPGCSSSSGQSESSSGENQAVDGGSQDLSHSEHDDSSEKMGLISEAASPPGTPEQQPPPNLALAISSWVQFEDDTPWANASPPPKETDGYYMNGIDFPSKIFDLLYGNTQQFGLCVKCGVCVSMHTR